ncbi:MAG: hypothetical protein Q4C87_05950 [Actinomycetaceae bacterium]|nr:hypothetical protein [Actinomycetaceae bacterium]
MSQTFSHILGAAKPESTVHSDRIDDDRINALPEDICKRMCSHGRRITFHAAVIDMVSNTHYAHLLSPFNDFTLKATNQAIPATYTAVK